MGRKIINDPVYGFITVTTDFIQQLVDHPWFQRLRRIKQLGLSHYVYPGALHTRFHHALGAMHLMTQALNVLASKGHRITEEEREAASVAILLHDIGHGPFSHALENAFTDGADHEQLTLQIMNQLNDDSNGNIALAIEIFKGEYPKKFLHQLVSSQLDVDRLDYLNRDSFFTGVSEGVIGYDRIIKMMNVLDGELVVEQKGIYSVEKFLLARRLMYWQVYLHKTVIVTEMMVRDIFKRAKEIGAVPNSSSSLAKLLSGAGVIGDFLDIDDNDVVMAIKNWRTHEDNVLSDLCIRLINRNLLKIELREEPFAKSEVESARSRLAAESSLPLEATSFLVFTGSTTNHAYKPDSGHIGILTKENKRVDLIDASDFPNLVSITEPVVKFYLCSPEIGAK